MSYERRTPICNFFIYNVLSAYVVLRSSAKVLAISTEVGLAQENGAGVESTGKSIRN
jgi:hypothetical protein